MRIALVVAGGVDRSGTRRVVPHLLDRIAALARSHDVQVVALRQEPEPGHWTCAGADVWNVGRRPRRVRALARLRALHAATPLDVIHGFGLVPQGVVAAAAGRLLGVPVVLEAPGGEFADLADVRFGGWRRLPGRLWIRRAVAGRTVVVPSTPAAALATRRGVRARRIGLEVDGAAWPSRPASARGDAPARLVWVGSLAPVKDPLVAVEAAHSLRALGARFTLDMVGEDFLGGAVHARARTLGLADVVRFRGFLPQGELVEIVRSAHLLLLTSRFEGGPRALLEAATQGVPTVGPPVGYLEEWAPEAARAVSPWSADALAEAVHALLLDDAARVELGWRAGERVRAHDAAVLAECWAKVYRDAVAGTESSHG